MADKDTLNLIKFKFGNFQSIKDLSSKDQSSFYFASDVPTFYNAGLWYGVSSLTSSVDEETGEVTLVINGGFGDNWKSSQVTHKFVAGMTTQQKADLEKAVSFVDTVTSTEGEDTQTIIDKWNEIVAFLAGFKETDVLLDRITTLETNVTNLQNTTITGGDGLTGGGNLLGNRTIAMGTPSTITDSTINEAKGTTHTHAIDEASTEQRGIVRLNDTLTYNRTDQALTANQGRVLKEYIDEMFELIDKGNGVKEIKAKYGLWSDSFISARGVDNESSGVGGLDAQAVWDLLMQNDDATKVINIAHIPDISISKIKDFPTKVSAFANDAGYINASHIANKADKATTLSGYGITDAVNTNSGQFVNGTKYFKDTTYSVRFSVFVKDSNDNVKPGYASQFYRKMSGDVDQGTQILHATNGVYIGFNIQDNNIYINNNGVYKHIYSTEKGLIADMLGAKSASDFVDLTSAQTITGIKTFNNLIYQYTDDAGDNAWSRGIFLRFNNNNIGAIGAYGPNSSTLSHLYLGWGRSPALSTNNFSVGENKFTYKGNTIYHVGNLSPVTTDTEQTITGVKTFSNAVKFGSTASIGAINGQYSYMLSGGNEIVLTGGKNTLYINSRAVHDAVLPSVISFNNGSTTAYSSIIANRFISKVPTGTAPFAVDSTTMVTNLNADKVDGYDSTGLFTCESGNDINVNAPHPNKESGTLLYKISSNCANIPPSCTDGVLVNFNYPKTDTAFQIASNYHNTGLYYRSGNLNENGTAYLYNRAWKQLAFTDSNVASAQTLKHSNGKVGAIVAENGRLEKVYSLYNTYGVGVKIAQGSVPTSVGNLSPAVVFGLQDAIQSSYGTAIWGTSNGRGHIQVGRLDKTDNAYSLCLQEFGGNVGIGTDAPTAKLHVDGDSIINGKLTVANQLTIGNATLYWDVVNQCLRVNAGIASDSFLSAKGIDTTGNGQGGGGGFDAQMLWNELTTPSPTNAGKTIMLDLLPDMPTSKVTDFANQVKVLITVENIPTLTSAKISDFNAAVATAMSSTLSDISSNLSNHEQRLQAIEQALTWQGVN